jgi:hypothetical protein
MRIAASPNRGNADWSTRYWRREQEAASCRVAHTGVSCSTWALIGKIHGSSSNGASV